MHNAVVSVNWGIANTFDKVRESKKKKMGLWVLMYKGERIVHY